MEHFDIDPIVGVINSPNKLHRYRAIFASGEWTDFGSPLHENYTMHHDIKRKFAYIRRHQKREDWDDYKSAGALSRWILWNKPTLEESFEDYRKRFDMNKVRPIKK